MSMTSPVPEVPSRRILRRLGVPDDVSPSTEWLDLIAQAADWYSAQGKPWRVAEEVAVDKVEQDRVRLACSATLNSEVLARGFASADVTKVLLVAVSAGPEVDAEIQRLYAAQLPAEAQFLATYAACLTEQLRLIELAEHDNLLPPYAPGYHGWQLGDQAVLYELLNDRGPLRLGSGSCLTPLCSSIAVAGRTRQHTASPGFWRAHGGHSCKGDCLRCDCSKN